MVFTELTLVSRDWRTAQPGIPSHSHEPAAPLKNTNGAHHARMRTQHVSNVCNTALNSSVR